MEFIVYLLKVNIALALFYGIYRLLFRQDTFFQWKRFTLLVIVFISFLYPAIDLSRQLVVNQPVKNILETVYIPVYHLPEVIISQNTTATVHLFPQMVLIIYFTISCLLLIRLLFQVGAIGYKLFHTKKIRLQGQTVYESPGLKTPFSFFRWIVLDSSRYSETELQEILLHETSHVEQKHSVDTLLAETMCIVCWFNPFAWLLKTEIRMNLEFLADRSVLNSGYGAEHYQFHLLRLSYHKAAATITNNFNVSLLKKRIFMMNKKQTPHRSVWKYASILPVFAILLFFNSAFGTTQPGSEINDIRQTPVPKETKQIFEHCEQMPEYPGGTRAFLEWVMENVVYPKEALDKRIQGRVSIRFVIAPDGSVEDPEILRGLDPAIDREAIEVVKKSPKWIPGKQNGIPVYVYFSLPLVFRLDENNKSE